MIARYSSTTTSVRDTVHLGLGSGGRVLLQCILALVSKPKRLPSLTMFTCACILLSIGTVAGNTPSRTPPTEMITPAGPSDSLGRSPPRIEPRPVASSFRFAAAGDDFPRIPEFDLNLPNFSWRYQTPDQGYSVVPFEAPLSSTRATVLHPRRSLPQFLPSHLLPSLESSGSDAGQPRPRLRSEESLELLSRA